MRASARPPPLAFSPPEAWSDRRATSWIYVIVCGEFVKVGIGKPPVARLASIAGASPYDVSLWGAYAVPRELAIQAEAFCHVALIAHHHRGEWFRADPALAFATVRRIARRACHV